MSQKIDRLLDEIVSTRMAIEAELWELVEESVTILKEIAPVNRKTWLASVKQKICLEQNFDCAICSERMAPEDVELDHIVPVAYGGGNERSNVRATHRRCNRNRGTSTDVQLLLRYLEDRYMNLPGAQRLLWKSDPST
jgi:5-methylcytosine-specific restriction endonuclease McrA